MGTFRRGCYQDVTKRKGLGNEAFFGSLRLGDNLKVSLFFKMNSDAFRRLIRKHSGANYRPVAFDAGRNFQLILAFYVENARHCRVEILNSNARFHGCFVRVVRPDKTESVIPAEDLAAD